MTLQLKTAMVLGAGMGNRMRPLTDAIPKPMVPLAGRPLIDHVLDRLAAAGIERAIVNVHYLADKLERHLKTRSKPKIAISDERGQLLDTGAGVVKALPLLGPTPFLIHNSNSVWLEGVGANLPSLAAIWDDARMDCLMLLALGSSSIGYDGHGDFNMDPNGLVSRRPEHREAPFVFTGVSIAHPRMFDGAPKGAFSLNLLWDKAIERGRLYGMRLDGTWMHVGTCNALDEAERLMARGEAS